MRFHKILLDVMGSSASVRVLQAFFTYPKKKFSGRELARQTSLSPMGAWRPLKTLESYGVITRARIGQSDAWQLNEKHFLSQKLASLNNLEKEAVNELTKLLLKHLPIKKIEKIYLFGSVGRGNEKPSSDVDILIVAKEKKDKQLITKASGQATNEAAGLFANHLSIIVFSKNEFNKSTNLFNEIRSEGKVLYPAR